MRILICIEALGVGGKERQAVELAKGLAGRPGVDCLMVCLQGDDFYLHELTKRGIAVEFVVRRRRWDVGVFPRLARIVKRYRPHLIHTYGMMSSFYALPIARLERLPLINASIQNAFTKGGLRWSLEKCLLKASEYRVANSSAGLRSRGFSVTARNNCVIVNGFDFSRLEHIAREESFGRDQQEGPLKIVGMVAEFNRYKDYATFIRAAQKINSRRGDVLFLTVGAGETLAASRQLAAGSDSIQFVGERKDVEQIIASFDIGVLSTFTEGISNSIMEYMALRKPVVATDGGGTKELVVEGETGFLVPASNPDTLAERIEYLLDNPALAQRMGRAGEARLKREFSLARMVEETVTLYQLAMAHSPSAAHSEDVNGSSGKP